MASGRRLLLGIVAAGVLESGALAQDPAGLQLRGQSLDTRMTLRVSQVTLGNPAARFHEAVGSLGVEVQLREPPPEPSIEPSRAELRNRTLAVFAGAQLSKLPEAKQGPRPLRAPSRGPLPVTAWPTVPALACVLLLTALLVVRRRQAATAAIVAAATAAADR